MRRFALVAMAAAVLGGGCGSLLGDAKDDAPVLSERLNVEGKPFFRGEVGAECTRYEGNTGCKSDLCLRVEPGFPPKGFCSIHCDPAKASADCPDGPGPAWECRQLFPSAGGWVCAPDQAHDGTRKTLRGEPVPLPAAKIWAPLEPPPAPVGRATR